MASPDAGYVGSMVGEEDAFPAGIRRRAIEAPLGPKIGYHEIDDEKEEADEDWMLGEASQLSGAGTRGSSNWVLKVMVPILLIVGIIVMHNWWTDIKEQISAASKAMGDVFDRRALVGEVEGGGVAREQEAMSPSGREGRDVDVDADADVDAHVEGRQEGLPDKAVYSVSLGNAPANAGGKQP
ncbi:unnamed protein product [Pylaiella littoralis]